MILTLASSFAFAGGAGKEYYYFFCVNYASKTSLTVDFKKQEPIHIGSSGHLDIAGSNVSDLHVTVNAPRLIQLKSTHDENKSDVTAEFILAKDEDVNASAMRIQIGDKVQLFTDITCM